MDINEGPSNLNLGHQRALKPIETRRATTEGEGTKKEGKAMVNGERTPVDEPLSPGARLFHAPGFNCFIVAIIGCKTVINVDVVKAGLEHTLLKHPRFSSILGGKKRWIRTNVNLENHIIVPDLSLTSMDSPGSDQFVEDYVSNLTTTSMELTRPLWQLHILNLKTSDANSVVVFKLHHSIGDGASLISLVLACTRKSSDPGALPSIPVKEKPHSRNYQGRFWLVFVAVWHVLGLIWNTLVDLMMVFATILFLKDTETLLKGAKGVALNPKRIVYRKVSLDDIKLVKTAMNMTINDILLGVTQAGLSRYLNRRYCEVAQNNVASEKKSTLPKRIRLRASLLVNIRPSTGIEALADMMEKGSKVKWGNCIGYVLLPFKIALKANVLDYVLESKATIDRKKHSLESFCTFSSAVCIIKIFGVKVAGAIIRRVLSNTTMSFSNVVGPVEEISFYGHPMAYLAPTVFGHPQALTIHFQSYVDKMTIVLAVDQGVIPDPHQLCDDLEESLKLIKKAVIEEGLTHNIDAC